MRQRFALFLWRVRVRLLMAADALSIVWVLGAAFTGGDVPGKYVPAVWVHFLVILLLIELAWRVVPSSEAIGEARGPIWLGMVGPWVAGIVALFIDAALDTSVLLNMTDRQFEWLTMAAHVPAGLAYCYAAFLLLRRFAPAFVKPAGWLWVAAAILAATLQLSQSDSFRLSPYLPLVVAVIGTSALVRRSFAPVAAPPAVPGAANEGPTFRPAR